MIFRRMRFVVMNLVCIHSDFFFVFVQEINAIYFQTVENDNVPINLCITSVPNGAVPHNLRENFKGSTT